MLEKSFEEKLIARVVSGDRESFHLLVESYQGRVYALAYTILRSREDAEDVTQEAFVKAYLSLGEFRGEGSFYTWLYRIVHNMALDHRRKLIRRGGPSVDLDESMPADAGLLLGRLEAPHEALTNSEKRRHLLAAFKILTEEHRVALILREVDGLSYEEIARVTGVARGTVMSRLHYARKKIQEELQKLEGECETAGPPASRPGPDNVPHKTPDGEPPLREVLERLIAAPILK